MFRQRAWKHIVKQPIGVDLPQEYPQLLHNNNRLKNNIKYYGKIYKQIYKH